MTRVRIEQGEYLKTDDTEPNLIAQLLKDNDNPKDLSSGTPEVSFYLTEANSSDLIVDDNTSGNVTISDASSGEVTYSWQAADTSTPGTYIGEFEVVQSGETSTYPNSGTFTVYIEDGLN